MLTYNFKICDVVWSQTSMWHFLCFIWLKCSFGEVQFAANPTWIEPVVPKFWAIEGLSNNRKQKKFIIPFSDYISQSMLLTSDWSNYTVTHYNELHMWLNKIYFLLFPKWLFFQFKFGAKIFEIGNCILEIWQFHWGCQNRLVKSWFWEKGS